jgi:hypothetical protein
MSFNLDISQCEFQRPPINSDIYKNNNNNNKKGYFLKKKKKKLT